jgi:hypothetical protein
MKEYGAKQVSVIVNGTPITGAADGVFATVARNVESSTLHIGADGIGTKVDNADKSGTITLRLAQSSPSNAVLSALEATSAVFPVIVKDTNGNSLHSGAKAFIGTMPSSDYAQELSMREWVIQVEALIHFEGGNPDV